MPRPIPIEPTTLLASAFFTGAGTLHFARPDVFEAIVPDWFPDAPLANYVSGAAEVVLGVGLLPRRTRRWSAIGLIALLAIVFPANLDMAVNDVEVTPVDGTMTRSVGTASGPSRLVNWVRLPLQLPLASAMWRIARRSA
ncbi:MAG: DoxX family protein [Ilumatobacter sp.]|uniref:DoxX family protein n=1 Tax=Ilumatobacter sp. TaxID=1967498 RepID=UPI00329A546D